MSKEDLGSEFHPGHFEVLSSCECIRRRPGMYIGDTGGSGLLAIVLEPVIYAVENTPLPLELTVTLRPDGEVRIDCPGLTLPVEHLEAICTQTGTGAPHCRQIARGLHGFRLLAANALSASFQVDVHTGGHLHRQAFSRGQPLSPAKRHGHSPSTATTFTFTPDPAIFSTTAIPAGGVADFLREQAVFSQGSRLILKDRDEPEQVFHSPAGLADLLAWRTPYFTPVCAPITGDIETEEGRASIAFGWYEDAGNAVHCYCNGGYVLRGEHMRGVRSSLAENATVLGQRMLALRAAIPPRGRVTFADVARMGFVAVISFELADPMYGAPTRDHLNNTEAYRLSVALVRQCLERFAQDRPADARAVEAFLIAAHIDPKTGAPNVVV